MTFFCPLHDSISSFFRISSSAIWTTHRWHELKYISTRILMKCNVWEACTALKQTSRSHVKLGWKRKRDTSLKKRFFATKTAPQTKLSLQNKHLRNRGYLATILPRSCSTIPCEICFNSIGRNATKITFWESKLDRRALTLSPKTSNMIISRCCFAERENKYSKMRAARAACFFIN